MTKAQQPDGCPPSAPVTLVDVASLAGVSTSAVSRTFTPGASVAEKTRARVLEAAQQLGYRPNAIARTLSTRKSRIIAVVVSYLQNQFYPTIIEKLSQSLQAHGYHILLFISDDATATDSDSLLLDILQYQVDGIVLASTMLSSRLAAHCHAANIPVVLFNRVAVVQEVSTVVSDNEEGGRLAAQLLVKTGARRIGFIAGLEDSSTSQERERGFVEELQRQGQTLFARETGQYDFALAAAATRRMFHKPEKPDALFVGNDHMAFAVLDTVRNEFGLAVPDDVQVIGFDNVPQSAWGGYQLTTIEQNADLMTQATVSILLERISSGLSMGAGHVKTPVAMVHRATTLHQLETDASATKQDQIKGQRK
ncbi:MAG: LacI family DNA-binding transcriptional regulator [Burkholderiaceae bacterium]